MEDWTVLQATYFLFVSFTTVGFGDLIPASNVPPKGTPDYRECIAQLAQKALSPLERAFFSEVSLDNSTGIVRSILEEGMYATRFCAPEKPYPKWYLGLNILIQTLGLAILAAAISLFSEQATQTVHNVLLSSKTETSSSLAYFEEARCRVLAAAYLANGEDWKAIFQQFRLNDDGYIKKAPFLSGCREVLLIPKSGVCDEHLRDIFDAIDANGDGYVSPVEFGSFLSESYLSASAKITRQRAHLDKWRIMTTQRKKSTKLSAEVNGCAGNPAGVVLIDDGMI